MGLFIITIFATISFLIVGVYFTFESFYRIAKGDAVSIGEKSIYETAEHLNNFLINGIDVMTVTSQTVEYMMKNDASISDIQEYLFYETEEYRKKNNPYFSGIYGYIDGYYIDGDGWTPPEGFDPAKRNWYKSAWWTLGKTTLVPPYEDVKSDKIIVSVSRMLYDWSVLSLDIQLDELQNFTESIKSSGYNFIIDRSGLIVAHSDREQIGRNLKQEKETSDYARKICRSVFTRGDTTTKNDMLNLNGEKCYVFSQQVQGDWFVVQVVSESLLFKKVKFNLIRNIIFAIAIFLVVAYFSTTSLLNLIKSKTLADLLAEHQKSLKQTIKDQTSQIVNQTKELVEFQRDVIEGVAQLIESRDGSTGEHVKNTRKYVNLLATHLYENGLYPEEIDEKFVEVISNAATLHDVGKIHIPDSILNKQGRFTNEEFDFMKKHAEYGGDVINTIFGKAKDARMKKITYETVRYHHERWNGSGYPEKLAGKDIPLCARIMTIADVYDALSSKRAYKDAISDNIVIQMMKTDSGTIFDPELLTIFLNLIEEK